MIENIDKTIEFLQELRKEEQKKQLGRLNDTLKNEIYKSIQNTLLHFESDEFVKFREENKINLLFDYNLGEVLEKVKDTIKVDIWEID